MRQTERPRERVSIMQILALVEDRLVPWPWLVCLGAALWAGLVCFPPFSTFSEPFPLMKFNWNALRLQIEHPFTPLGINANYHAGQIGRRLTIPLFAHLLHLRLEHLFLLQFASLPIFLRLVWKSVAQAANSRLALWAVLGLSACFVSQTFWWDTIGNFDCFAFMLVAGVLAARNDAWASVWLFLALFTDERVFVILPLLAAWRHFGLPKGKLEVHLWPIKPGIGAMVAITLVALGMRAYLKTAYGLGVEVGSTPDVGPKLILSFWQSVRYALFSALELGWIAVLCLPLQLWRRHKVVGLGMMLYLAAATVACLSVVDLSRSVSFLFPAALLGWVVMDHSLIEGQGRKMAAFAAIAGLLIPPMMVVGHTIHEPGHGFFPTALQEAAKGIRALLHGLPQ